MTQAQVSFHVEKKYQAAYKETVKKGMLLAFSLEVQYPRLQMEMDLAACHANGNPLDFERMAKANDGNLGHDLFGIRRFLDRNTGKLTDCFVPRFSMPHKNDAKFIKDYYAKKVKKKRAS